MKQKSKERLDLITELNERIRVRNNHWIVKFLKLKPLQYYRID